MQTNTNTNTYDSDDNDDKYVLREKTNYSPLKRYGYFTVECCVKPDGTTVFKCSGCGSTSGKMAVEYPDNPYFFAHNYNCPFLGMTPKADTEKTPDQK